jgi:hypothetical protein
MRETLLISLNVSMILFWGVVLLWILAKMRRLKRGQDRLVETVARKGPGIWFRVNVARPPHFARRLKLIGIEAKGLLIDSQDQVRVVAELPSGERIDHSYPKGELGLQWIGNAGIASSNMHWIAIGKGERTLMVCADTGLNALQSRESTADMCRMIDPQIALPDVAKADFALEKNPASLAAVAAFFALVVFGVLDGVMLNRNELLEMRNAGWGFPVAAALALPFYWWMSRTQVPSRESLTVTMLLAIALVGAYIPAIKRADQLLSADGAQPVAYRLGPNASLEPLSSGPPKINYSRAAEYWAQFEEGSTHQLDLTRGPLGLWQLDRSKLEKDMRRFYEGKRPRKSKHEGAEPRGVAQDGNVT